LVILGGNETMKHRLMFTLISIALAAASATALAQSDTATPPPPDTTKAKDLGTVEVTGSAIPRTSKETPSPVIVITALDIKRSGLTTVADVVRSISADNSGTIPTAFTAGFAAGSSGVALRGLTVNSTLVLIDGRRVASYALADDGQRSFVDLNTIPLDAVDRIEVLKDGASSLYGADAIAGVVNVILKHDFRGGDTTEEVGNSEHGGGLERRATASWGTGSLDDDKYNAYVAFEYEGDDRITTTSRPFPFNTADLSSIGGFNDIGGQPAFDSGSIYGSVTPGQLSTPGNLTTGVANPGALSQPLRPCGPGSKLVNDPNNNLGGGAGSYCTQNFAQYGDDQPNQERVGVYGRFTLKLGDYSEAYLDASYYQDKVIVDGAPSGIQTSTPNNTDTIALPVFLPNGQLNPNNPFAAQGQYALINYAFGDIPGGSETLNHVVRVVAGVKGSWGEWNYDSAAVFNHTWLDSQLDGFINYTQLITDITNGSYNFVDPSQNSASVRAAIAQNLSKVSTSDMDSIDFRVSRPILQLAGGSMGLALGAEGRHEAQDDPDLNPGNNYQGLGIAHTVGSRDIGAVYTEIDAPVLKTLEIDASARYDHYSDFGGAFDPKIGFKFTPIDALAFRGTYSYGFRAPSFAENGSSAAEGFTTYQIPTDSALYEDHESKRGDPTTADAYVSNPYSLAQSTSANPNVKPERSKSFTFGTIIQPTSWLNLSLDYYSITKRDVITQSDPNVALADYEAGLAVPAGYTIITDTPDPQYPNALARPVAVAAPYINANSLHTDGIDLDMRAKFNLRENMQFISDITATDIFQWRMSFPDGSVQDYVGTQGPYILSSGAGTPRYRANWANTLIWGKLESTATIYYTSGLYMSAPDIEPGCFSAGPNGNFPPSCRSPSFTEVDLSEIFHLTKNIDITGGVDNLLDRLPPFDPIDYAGLNYNPTFAQSGIVGRFYKVGVHIKF
jgi:iron complex outermembrane receptor protein